MSVFDRKRTFKLNDKNTYQALVNIRKNKNLQKVISTGVLEASKVKRDFSTYFSIKNVLRYKPCKFIE
jgi:hypothetical protein